MLFDIVPDNFFHPLAAKSKIVYWECICILFRITNSELSFGIERNYLVDELQYYFESDLSADIGDDADDIDGSESKALKTGIMSPRDKANLMLRQLERWGGGYIQIPI